MLVPTLNLAAYRRRLWRLVVIGQAAFLCFCMSRRMPIVWCLGVSRLAIPIPLARSQPLVTARFGEKGLRHDYGACVQRHGSGLPV